MKYLIINGSPRKKHTWEMVKQAKSNLDGEFEEIHLMKEKIPMCNGCFKCFMESEKACPHFDMINPIVEKISACDGLIIASPVYALNVPGLLKNFLDHTAYLYHRPPFFDKKALIVVSTAGAGENKVAKYIDETLRHWGFNKNYKIAIKCGGKESLETKDIDKVSRKFGEDVKSGNMHAPKFMDILYYNIWRALASSNDPIIADKIYWENSGLIEHEFSPVVKLNPIKKAFAKVIYSVMKKVM